MNFFKKKLEQKSFTPTLQSSIVIDNKGNILDTFFSTEIEEIKKNISVQTIVSKQGSIINEAKLVAKEKSDKSDEITNNKDVLKITNWFENPNSTPSPRSLEDIIRYIYKQYFTGNGLASIILTFDREVSFNTFKNIKLPIESNIVHVGETSHYQVKISNQRTVDFKYSIDHLNYINKQDGEIRVLLVLGNYNIEKSDYESPFKDIISYIKLQNHLINFATSFHENACFPSQIVQMTYKNLEKGEALSDPQMAQFEKAVEQVKLQLQQSKSSKNAGRMIVPVHPALDIEIKPLQVPTNATDNIAYQDFVSSKIFSFVDGGSAAAFEGKSEYANNASAKLQDLYDGSFRMANSVIAKPLTNLIRNLLLIMKSKVNKDDIYLTFDISNVKIYQTAKINQLFNVSDRNLTTINEGRQLLGKFDDDYANLQDIESGKWLNKEITKEVAIKQDNKFS